MILFLVLFSLIFNQTDEVTSIVKIQNKFESLQNIEADFIQSVDDKKIMKGKFFFSQMNNYRIELKNNIIISDGKSIWNIDNKRKKVIISNIDNNPLAFSLRDYIFNYPQKCDVSEEDYGERKVITLFPLQNQNQMNFKLAKIWIDQNYLIRKIEVYDFGNNLYLFEFNNIKIDQSLNEDKFKFNNSDSLKIIDLR